jgi:hypothetical protein
MRWALLLISFAACTQDAQVLDDPAGVVLTCEEAWQSQSGAPCALDAPCARESPADPMCCTDFAYCAMDGLVTSTTCDPSCGCTADSECEYGVRICNGMTCELCQDPETVCPPCPVGWERLLRNGCGTCACAPPSECEAPGGLCDDQVSQCYAGAACADMCDAFTPGCCSNACGAPGCADPAPVGCYTDCPVELGCGTGICATERCTCDGARWTCDAVCVDDLNVTCVYP